MIKLKANNGYFGEYGGKFIPEILHEVFKELEEAFYSAADDAYFWAEFKNLLETYSCRPTPLTFAENLTAHFGGPRIYIKREDLNHTGAHKFNNVLGQALLAKRMGKTRLIAETGAGQHGMATATIAAKFGFDCTIYMGEVDVRRQQSNVFWMRKMGAEVISVTDGSRTLKDAVNAAFKDWVTNPEGTHYLLGTVCGPHPFPEMVACFQQITGEETRAQILKAEKRLPSAVYACVGGGSNAIGIFQGFIDDKDVNLIGVEAGGDGLSTGRHAARFGENAGSVGIAQGYKSYFLQNQDGQMQDTHSIAAGLDYVGVSPIFAHLHDTKRVRFDSATDKEVVQAHELVMKKEGIIGALESTHGIACAFRDIKAGLYNKDDIIVLNMSGRGDKDIFTIAEAYDDADWKDFLRMKVREYGNGGAND